MESHENSTPKATILLVDDDIAILEGVTDLLELSGYHVIPARSGRDALNAMREQVPDLVISDIAMPDMDGYEFFRAVRSNPAWTPIPFIFLTARSQPADVRLGSNLGADAYVTKPFAPDDLLAVVENRLRRVRDIESQVRADVERMKQQLIMVFSHELRTPLTYIYGYVDMLQEQLDELDHETILSMLSGMRRGAERLTRLVEDLMLTVRIDSGVVGTEITLRREPSRLLSIVSDVVGRQQPAAAASGVLIETAVPLELQVDCVPFYLHDAVARLVDNAVKFSKQGGGRVRISAEQRDGEVQLVVSDEGIGIDPRHLPAIFERFSQANREVIEQQGVGLGLTIARDLVRLHGGRITVESEPGVGSTFTIHLPAVGA
jgi:signal transduction histidine kinase